MELAANQAAQSPADHGARVGRLGQSAGKQVDVVDVTVDTLQSGDGGAVHHVAQLVKSLYGRQSAEFAPLDVARNAVIAAVLNDLSGQIQSGASGFVLEHVIGHDVVDGRILRLGESAGQSFDDFIQAVSFVELERSVETGTHFLFGNFTAVAEEAHLFGQEGGDESQGWCRHRIGHTRIDVDVVSGEIAAEFWLQSVFLHDCLAENDGQELRIGDVLHLGADNATRLLEQRLIGPMRIDDGQFFGQTVVLANENDVDGRQFRVLVHSDISRFETPESIDINDVITSL